MDGENLRTSWKKTTAHLNAAKTELPPVISPLEEGWSVARYEEWLGHNGSAQVDLLAGRGGKLS